MKPFGDERSSRSIPTGYGSRGGTVPHTTRAHRDGRPTTAEERAAHAAYTRDWRALHPEYRDRENLRRARARAAARGDDPALITEPPRRRPRKVVALACSCTLCACPAEVVVTVCGLCREGLHDDGG